MLLLSASRVFPQDSPDSLPPVPGISDISIINDNRALYVNFILKNGFPDDISETLKSGIPLTFMFDIMLEQPGTFLDTTVVSRSVVRKIKFDTLKGEYMVSFDPRSPRVIMVNGEDEAKRLVSRVNRIPLIQLSMLTKGEVYRLRVRAAVEKKRSAIAFTGILNLFSSWGFQTDWHEVIFNY